MRAFNCAGSLYGASSRRDLGGCRFYRRLPTSRSISQPFAHDASDRSLGALYIVDAETDPVAVTEIKFNEIAVKVFLTDVLVDTVDAALQYGTTKALLPPSGPLDPLSGHSFPYAMSNEPAGLEVDTQHAAELICAESLLAAAQKMQGLKPYAHRDMAFLEDGADLDSERLSTSVAFIDADAGALAFQRSALIDNTAVWTDTSIWPNDCLNIGIGGLLMAEARLVENRP
jgi:hypothetical protein